MRFKVKEALKGINAERKVTLRAGDSCSCTSRYPDKGTKYIVFAKAPSHGETDFIELTYCTGMETFNEALLAKIKAATNK